MDFSLNDIQQMMQDSAARFVQNEYDFETRRKLVDSELGYSQDNWKLFADLGWLALPIAEAYGGLDGTLVDIMVLQQELGKGLVVEPFFATVLLAANLVQKLGSEEQKETIVGLVAAGESKLALAYAENGNAFDVTQIATTATKTENGYQLNGHKAVALGAGSADQLLVVARTAGESGQEEGISVFLVSPDQQGVSLRTYPTNDGHRAADVNLEEVQVGAESLIGAEGQAFDAIKAVLNEAIVALAAEAVGVMDKLLAATTEYAKTREQFGQKIGRFQVLQHRMADMFVECEQSRSMLYFAALQISEGSEDSDRIAAMLKVKIGNSARFVGQQAVQLHGGMGITDELDVGHFFKRLTSINAQLGSRDFHLNRLITELA